MTQEPTSYSLWEKEPSRSDKENWYEAEDIHWCVLYFKSLTMIDEQLGTTASTV